MQKLFGRNKKFPVVARILLGLIFTLSGMNYVFGLFDSHLLEVFNPHLTESGASFVENLKAAGFIWPLLKFTELICGLLLIFGYFGPLALFVLAPITVVIVCFHLFLSRDSTAIIGYIAFGLEVFLLFYFRKYYKHLLTDFTDDVDHNTIA